MRSASDPALEDIEQLRRTEAEQFYKRYYTPENMTIAIAGDVNPAEAKRMAEKYFARLPKGPIPPLVRTVEPLQEGEKRVAVSSAAQPFLAMVYKRPDQYSKDDAVLVAEALRHQHLDGLAEHLLAAVAEQLLGLAVHQLDRPAAVDDHHGVGGRLEQAAELGLDPPAVADVAHFRLPVVE